MVSDMKIDIIREHESEDNFDSNCEKALDNLIDKSPLASLPNLKQLNNKPFVREDFISAEAQEPSEDPGGTGPESAKPESSSKEAPR